MRYSILVITLTIVVPAQANPIIFVAPNGQDGAGRGTEALPFRTISAAMQSQPAPGTIVQLAPGTYSLENGESFPIQIPRGVILRGNEPGRGEGVLISGGGFFVSPSFARQNVAILADDGSQVRGVTLTNSLRRGYGLWVESGENVSIVNNTFVNNAHDGVFLTGRTRGAVVLANIFQGNRANGISIVGESTGEIRENVFDNTGFGIAAGQRSAVSIVNNRITNNRSGIVLSNVTTPRLRGNLIANNREDGLVILRDRVSQPNPDMGTPADPGENVFQNNGKRDIKNASLAALSAFGNQVDSQRVVNVTLSGAPSGVANVPPAPPNAAPVVPPVVIDRQPAPPAAVLPTPPAAVLPAPPATTFRVFVPFESEARTARLRTIVPGAFAVNRGGRRLLQAGAFSSREEANVQVRRLTAAGFRATIE